MSSEIIGEVPYDSTCKLAKWLAIAKLAKRRTQQFKWAPVPKLCGTALINCGDAVFRTYDGSGLCTYDGQAAIGVFYDKSAA
jgi:hypothetical protein